MQLRCRQRVAKRWEDLPQEMDEAAVRHRRMNESQGHTRSRRSAKKIKLNSDRDNHKLVGRSAKEPAKDIGQVTADDKNPVNALMEPRPRRSPPPDR